MKDDQNEIFKTMEFLIMVDIFSIFLFKMEIYCQDGFQKLSLLPKRIFLLIVIYFWNKLPNKKKIGIV